MLVFTIRIWIFFFLFILFSYTISLLESSSPPPVPFPHIHSSSISPQKRASLSGTSTKCGVEQVTVRPGTFSHQGWLSNPEGGFGNLQRVWWNHKPVTWGGGAVLSPGALDTEVQCVGPAVLLSTGTAPEHLADSVVCTASS